MRLLYLSILLLLLGVAGCAPPGSQAGRWSSSGVITSEKHKNPDGEIVSIDAVLKGRRLMAGGAVWDEQAQPLIFVSVSGADGLVDLRNYNILGSGGRFISPILWVKNRTWRDHDLNLTQLIAVFDRKQETVILATGTEEPFMPGMRLVVVVDKDHKIQEVTILPAE